MVMVLLLALVMGIVQVTLLVHARNVAAATAADAARYGAAAGRTSSDAAAYAERALRDALGATEADRLSCSAGTEQAAALLQEVRVECRGRLSLRILGTGSVAVKVVGHAVRETG